MRKRLRSFVHKEWNLRVDVWADSNRGYCVEASRIIPGENTPFRASVFIDDKPKEFSTREAAVETARIMAGATA